MHKVTEVFKDQFLQLHHKCDRSFGDQSKEDFNILGFNKALHQNYKINYNSSNMMLAEVTVVILIAVLKNCLKRNGKNVFVPTTVVIKELRKYMFVEYVLNRFIFGELEEDDGVQGMEEFRELLEIIVDQELGGIENCEFEGNFLDHVEDEGRNLILLNSCLRSHEERIAFWNVKLQKLFTDSNKQWLLDQFKYSKLFLEKNSFEEKGEKF